MINEERATTPAGKNFPESLNREPMTNNNMLEIPAKQQAHYMIMMTLHAIYCIISLSCLTTSK
jgi:hypothetical protein